MRLLFIGIMVTFCALTASQMDPLYDFDAATVLQKGLYLAGGVSAGLDNALYDMDGKKLEINDLKYTGRDIWLPLKVGYCFNEVISAGVVVPIYRPYSKVEESTSNPDELKNLGLSNPWVWGKCLFNISNGFLAGPRLGIKMPFGAYTLEDDLDGKNFPEDEFHALTGDKSLAVDIAALVTYHPDACIFFDGQLAMRYSTESTYDYIVRLDNLPQHDVQKITPGMTLALRLEPGIGWGVNRQMGTALAAYYTTELTDSKHTATVDDMLFLDETGTGMSKLSVGIGQNWAIDARNNLVFRFLYDVMGTAEKLDDRGTISSDSIPMGMTINLGYIGVVPF